MNKIMETAKTMKEIGIAKAPGILAGLAIIGIGMTFVSSFKAGLAASKVLEEKKKDLEDTDPKDHKARRTVVVEGVKEVTPIILPALIMGGVSMACVYQSNKISFGRIAALSAAYTASEKTIKEVYDKMDETLGDKKARSVRDSILKDKLDDDKFDSDSPRVVFTGNGDVLCYDPWTKQPFRSTADKINKVISDASLEIVTNDYISLYDFLDMLGVDDIPEITQEYGWNAKDLICGNKLPIMISAQLNNSNEPCLVLDYKSRPKYDFGG